MANKKIWLGMAAMVLAFMVLAGCASTSPAVEIDLVGTTWVNGPRTLKFTSDTQCVVSDEATIAQYEAVGMSREEVLTSMAQPYTRDGNKVTFAGQTYTIANNGQTMTYSMGLGLGKMTFTRQ